METLSKIEGENITLFYKLPLITPEGITSFRGMFYVNGLIYIAYSHNLEKSQEYQNIIVSIKPNQTGEKEIINYKFKMGKNSDGDYRGGYLEDICYLNDSIFIKVTVHDNGAIT